MALDPKLAALLPRFLQDERLLARLRALEQDMTTGYISAQGNYQTGTFQKTKISSQEQ